MIITKQFLQKHTAGPDHAVALNKVQASILGMKYPLQYGWLNTIVGKQLDNMKALDFIKAKRK